jgi:hypothetical protein
MAAEYIEAWEWGVGSGVSEIESGFQA